MAKSKEKNHAPIFILTIVFMLILSSAVSVGVLMIPYERFKTYLHLAFMNQIPAPSAESDGVTGLVITENDQIPTETVISEQMTESGEVIRPSFGDQYAVLNCEKIGLSVPVYWGSSAELLERGACQTTSSVVIGETGNVVIDAHVNTFFADLDKIQVGDEIVLYTEYGIFTYQAKELVTFENTEKRYILPTVSDRLTLYTCQSQVLGTSTTRIGVLCDMVSKQFYPVGEGAQG